MSQGVLYGIYTPRAEAVQITEIDKSQRLTLTCTMIINIICQLKACKKARMQGSGLQEVVLGIISTWDKPILNLEEVIHVHEQN